MTNAAVSLLSQPLVLRRCTLAHRIIRSATYEGMADDQGVPRMELAVLYGRIVEKAPGTIITGFCAVSQEGRAMHPGQAGIWNDAQQDAWQKIATKVKDCSPDTRLFMQIAHTGRQTLARVTGLPVKGASSRACTYFRQSVTAMTEAEVRGAVEDFASAAERAKRAGFHGVQIHAAHGYLIHQFLSPHTNTRSDRWKDGGLFLQEIVRAVRERCGADFPLFLKVSHSDDRGLTPSHVIAAVAPVQHELDAVEVSYGTMEYALNIIRGDCPIDVVLRVNPLFRGIPAFLKAVWKALVFPFMLRKLIAFAPRYNAQGALALKEALDVPIIVVGGIRNLADMHLCLHDHRFDAVSLCRPFICEPGLVSKLFNGSWTNTACTYCNRCTVYCDSNISLRCYNKIT